MKGEAGTRLEEARNLACPRRGGAFGTVERDGDPEHDLAHGLVARDLDQPVDDAAVVALLDDDEGLRDRGRRDRHAGAGRAEVDTDHLLHGPSIPRAASAAALSA